MNANGITETEEHKRKADDSFLKPGGHQNMPRSPRLCTSSRKELSESLPNDNVIDSEHIVEELPARTYKNPNVALAGYAHNSRQSQRNQLTIESRNNNLIREFEPQVEEQLPLRLSKGLKGVDSELWGMKPLSSLKVSASIRKADKTITSSNAHLISSATQQNTPSTYNFSQLILKQKMKGKGVICNDLDKSINPGGAFMGQEDENPAFEAIEKSGTESFNDGLNLREWLNSAGHRMSKSGSLHIFKQIVESIDFSHSQGIVLQDLRPSCFSLLPSSKIKYIGSSGQLDLDKVMNEKVKRKRPMEHDICASQSLSTKQQKPREETRSLWQQQQQQQQQHHFTSIHGCSTTTVNQTYPYMNRHTEPKRKESLFHNGSNGQHASNEEKHFTSVTMQLEEKWYCSPEELNEGVCTFSSNIYSLGVLLFELLCNIESWEVHSAVMSDLGHRILPPRFLSENPKEAGFCLWLLHPEPSSRPNTRMIFESEFMHESEESNSGDDIALSADDEAETEQLLHFLILLKEEKRKQAAKLAEELSCVDEDIKEVERSYSCRTDSVFPTAQMNYPSSSDYRRSISNSCVNEARFMSNITQLENSYFSMRFQVQLKEASYDKDVLESRLRYPRVGNVNKEPRKIQSSVGRLGSFFEGLCKFACYSKFEELGTIRNRDLLNSANVICALSFDRDEDYIAAAGVSKKIKIFDMSTILCDSIDIQYPIVEMSNKSKLSCVCWNSYIKNHLASTDYDGVVQMWDAGTGQPLSKYMEHQKRAWSVDFSLSDPKMFASGSDDCSVKLWNISEGNSVGTIWSPANVCCVQFNPYSTNLLFFGSADYKVYGYDLRHTRIPWCTLSGHGKAISYVKFLDAETVVSASTDNSLKLWDLKKTSSSSDACGLTFKGHSNEKNFVGLSVLDGYIACGSETNEVYCYHKSLPVPITSHKFESIDPISGHSSNDDSNGQFVSSVCWRKKSNVLVAANSIGIVKLMQMV